MVAVGVHGGLPPEKIAVLVGLDIDRLRALFSHELAHGHDIVKFATLQQLARATEDGSVTGAKALLAASSESPAPEDPERKDTRGKTNAVMLELLTGGKR